MKISPQVSNPSIPKEEEVGLRPAYEGAPMPSFLKVFVSENEID